MEITALQSLDAHEAGAKCHLIDAKGNVVDAYVLVKGQDSSDYRIAKRIQRKNVVKIVEDGTDIETYDFMPLDVDFCVQIICGWGELTVNGEPYEFSKENCRDLLSKAPLIVNRVLDFCNNRENFIKG